MIKYNPVKLPLWTTSHVNRRARDTPYVISADCPKSATSSHAVCSGRTRCRLGHVNGKLSSCNASKERETVTRRQSLITCETNPARQSRRMKKRESRDKSRATATRQPLSRFLQPAPALSVYLSWRRCCFCSRWLIASCDVKINGPRCARQTIRVSSFFFIVFLLSSEIVSAARRRAPRWIG